jgi:hypothetical protein
MPMLVLSCHFKVGGGVFRSRYDADHVLTRRGYVIWAAGYCLYSLPRLRVHEQRHVFEIW